VTYLYDKPPVRVGDVAEDSKSGVTVERIHDDFLLLHDVAGKLVPNGCACPD
jgi:hypothetical protein